MNFAKIHSGIKTPLAALALFATQCCSPLAVKPPAPALTSEHVASVVSAFSEQINAVKTLFFTGTLTVEANGSENSVQILMIADANPIADSKAEAGKGGRPHGRMKIEITHPWGKPLLHILIEGERLDILDFAEKRFYRGSLKNRYLSDRLPVPLNPSILWSLARAFPVLLRHQGAVSRAGSQITLLDSAGENVQIFELYFSEPLPRRVLFCRENVKMVFSDFEDAEGILYARQVNFLAPDHKVDLAVEINQMTFNRTLPKAVFEMKAPRDFKTVRLRDDLVEH